MYYIFQDYFNTCSSSGQPIFNEENNCFANSQVTIIVTMVTMVTMHGDNGNCDCDNGVGYKTALTMFLIERTKRTRYI